MSYADERFLPPSSKGSDLYLDFASIHPAQRQRGKQLQAAAIAERAKERADGFVRPPGYISEAQHALNQFRMKYTLKRGGRKTRRHRKRRMTRRR